MSDIPDRCTDYGFCFRCGGLQEAGGDDFCVCQDDDDLGDWMYHNERDSEAEKRTE